MRKAMSCTTQEIPILVYMIEKILGQLMEHLDERCKGVISGSNLLTLAILTGGCCDTRNGPLAGDSEVCQEEES